jgi:hypothetical protein
MSKRDFRELWSEFKFAFCRALDEVGPETLAQAWGSLRNKTEFYQWRLMPAVARHLGYRLQGERQRCDFSLLDERGVPLFAVEAENAHPTAWQEMEYLCGLATPIKALLLSCEWEIEREKFLPEWCAVIRKHHSVISLDCLYGIIVGEGTDPFKYTFTLLDNEGDVLEISEHVISP